jgi:hypothetical protein
MLNMCELNDLQKAYVTLQDACSIVEGDRVKILRAAEDEEMGWDMVWAPSMDAWVGNEGTVISINDMDGFKVDIDDGCTCYVPFFVLEKLPTPTVEVDLSWLYTFCQQMGLNVDYTSAAGMRVSNEGVTCILKTVDDYEYECRYEVELKEDDVEIPF